MIQKFLATKITPEVFHLGAEMLKAYFCRQISLCDQASKNMDQTRQQSYGLVNIRPVSVKSREFSLSAWCVDSTEHNARG